jgi:hypothetical protein
MEKASQPHNKTVSETVSDKMDNDRKPVPQHVISGKAQRSRSAVITSRMPYN